jgi:hypothetical protein
MLAFLLTAAVCLGAILLPARLVAWWDEQRWFHSVFCEDVSQAVVSYSYALTTAERVALLSDYLQLEWSSDHSLNVYSDLSPAENEISAEQAVSLCLEEAKELTRLGLLPNIKWDVVSAYVSGGKAPSFQGSAEYVRVVDWTDTQRKISLWVISFDLSNLSVSIVPEDTGSLDLDGFTCAMDAETGALYFIACSCQAADENAIASMDDFFQSQDSAQWADYLGLTAPEITPYEDPELDADAQCQQLSFLQEDPAVQYYVYWNQSNLYDADSQVTQSWLLIAYTPTWPV